MLQLVVTLIPEQWDEEKEEFINSKTTVLQLEHSLISLSKWEAKWCKAFLSQKELTDEEILDYIKCMVITPNVKPEIYDCLTKENIDEIVKYISAPMTATTVRDTRGSKFNSEVVTSELIYHWMIELQIPFECQKWHLNRLITLIKVRIAKTNPPKKMSKGEIMRRNAELNSLRRRQMNSRG
jgi:hypothetical protein